MPVHHAYLRQKKQEKQNDIRNHRIKQVFVFDRDIPADASFTFVDFASGVKQIEADRLDGWRKNQQSVYLKRYR